MSVGCDDSDLEAAYSFYIRGAWEVHGECSVEQGASGGICSVLVMLYFATVIRPCLRSLVDVPAPERFVLTVVMLHGDHENPGWSMARTSDVVAMTGYQERHVRRLIGNLVKRGLLGRWENARREVLVNYKTGKTGLPTTRDAQELITADAKAHWSERG